MAVGCVLRVCLEGFGFGAVCSEKVVGSIGEAVP